ncbi:hypothetical protein LPJ53_000160 [Coemansia erecta]|uniref:Inner centromere protein ARK-binding domain-containing protein n=1 Tax=Coemansia erecta TaxID=147472 RepID=A0A9W8CVF6_9FUNG|nr:hypothetical protein LPJ53_000160 [Coemansia erecta]
MSALQLGQRHYMATEAVAQRDAARRSSGSTASDSSLATGSWLGGKKRDWDNAFLSKYQDLEATLQENDQWLTMYLESVSGMRALKKPDFAISEALKTSSTKRRGRSRMDVRDVFGNATVKLSPLASQFNTANMWSLKKNAKRRSSQYGTLQGNTLNMAIAQMAMMPPKSPYLTNVGKHSGDSALARSNSAAAKTAAAVKRLQAIEGSPPGKPAADPVSASSDLTMTSPGPVSAVSDMSVASPQRTAPVSRAAQVAPVPTLRDMLLNNHSPMRPPLHERARSAGQRTTPFSTIKLNLGSMAYEGRADERQQMQRRAEHPASSTPSSAESTPERLVSAADLNRSRSVTASEGEGELTRSEDEVRDRFQKVQIAFSRGNSAMGSISEQSEAAAEPLAEAARQPSATTSVKHPQHQRRQEKEADGALLAIEVDEDIAAMYRDIDEVSKMLPTSQESSQHDDSEDASNSGGEGHGRGPKTGGRFVDVDIDQQPMDVRLDDLSVDVEDEATLLMKKKAGSPGKRKLSDGGRSVSNIPSSAASARVRAPVAAARGRGRGRGKVRAGLHPPAATAAAPAAAAAAPGGTLRRPGLAKKASGSSTASLRSQRPVDGGQQAAQRPEPRAAHHVAGGVNKPRVAAAAAAAAGSSSLATGPGRVAEYRRRFETAEGARNAPAAAAASFSSPVVAMRPGYAAAAHPPSAAAKRGAAAAAAAAAPAGSRSQIAKAPIRTAAAGQKSSTAAMREAARRAEAARINAAATPSLSSSGPAARTQRTAREPLAKAAARPESRLSRNSSDSSLRSQAADRRPRPAPLNLGDQPAARPSAIPIPKPKAAAAAAAASSRKADDSASLADSGKAGSADSGGWGLSSVISMLSPASWKQQAGVAKKSSAGCLLETPTNAGRQKSSAASPYDVDSPQTPYRPRPEHAGSRADLVMPSYTDMAVPLRRTSGDRSSLSSELSGRADGGEPEGSNRAKRPSHLGTYNQRLLDVAGGRLSGVSSFRSSFFSDDEGAAAGSPRASGQGVKRGPSMLRTKSTPDLAQAQQEELERRQQQQQAQYGAMKTPVRHKRSAEYTSIIPDGSNSPPEIESDYSDEYSDDEFSPAPKRKKNDLRIPAWATTPELAKGLRQQEKINPDRIFGRVKPLRVEEIFNRRQEGRRKPRNSSMIWTGSDALTAEDELEYIRRMGFDP